MSNDDVIGCRYATQFQLQLLYSGKKKEEDEVGEEEEEDTFREVTFFFFLTWVTGTPTGLTGMYPALNIPVLVNFLPARRPW